MALFRALACFSIILIQVLAAEEIKPDSTLLIPMRDGTLLPADLYLPNITSTNLPCVLVRSPAGRQANSAKRYVPLAKQGYAVVIQETRSYLDKQGKTLPYLTDGWGQLQDGYDTVIWLSKSSYTNGNIGTAGFSALGITQLLLAPTDPPGLKCQYIGMAPANLFQQGIAPGGVLLKNLVEGWLGLFAKDPSLKTLICSKTEDQEFWKQFDTTQVANRVNVPALHYGGWFDPFVQGTLDAFMSRNDYGALGAKGQQKLLIGPWTHHWPSLTKLGDFEMPEAAKNPPIDATPQHWFDYYLKGISNGTDTMPTVTYYVMGPFDGTSSSGNIWRQADNWPVAAIETSLYLNSEFELVQNEPAKEAAFFYDYDPANLVPTIGGHNLFIESGPKDQRSIEQRKDVLTFTSEPLNEDLEITGRIYAKLYIAANKPNTDAVVRLCDVYPDGSSILIADGLSHLCPKAENDNPATPHEISIDLWSTSIVFAKGHRLRVSISASNYPRFEKNKSSEIIHNQLFIGKETPSQIILPAVRFGESMLIKPRESS